MKIKYSELIDQTLYFPTEEFNVEEHNLKFHDIPLMDLVERFGTPLKFNYLIMFVLFSSFKINNFKNETEKNSERLVFNKLKRKYIIINTALLSGAAVFFIPLFIKQLAARNLIQYSSIIFFYNFIYKVWNINSGNVDILFSSYIFILFKIYTEM